MDLKLGLKIGHIELTFEGSTETFENKIEAVFKELVEFGKTKFGERPEEQAHPNVSHKAPNLVPTMTVKSVAAKLGVDSGGALLYAAIASLAVIKNKETFSRHEVNDEMKLAVGYYKPTYSSGNLTGYLDALIKKGTIIELSKDTYAVKDAARTEMEQRLAQ